MNGFLTKIKGDKAIWFVVFMLSILSFLVVYSATGTLAYRKQGGDVTHYMLFHGMLLFFGLLAMYIAHLLKYTLYSRIFQILYVVAIILLVATLFYGLNFNNAKRSLPLPFNFTFQTFDFAKLALIGYLARVLSKKRKDLNDFKTVFLHLFLPVALVCSLILPSNLSTAALVFLTSIILIFIGRVSLLKIGYIILISILGLGVFFGILSLLPVENQGRLSTWKERIEEFGKDSPENNYQLVQSKIAIATGGVFGKMPGNSTQRNFLPHPYSDFIYAIIVEEYGLTGGVVVLFLYLILLYRAIRIVTKVPNNFGVFLAIGLSLSLVLQALVNMMVAVGLVPVTGQPLPMVSMGGTSVIFTGITIGILLSVSRQVDEEKEKLLKQAVTDEK